MAPCCSGNFLDIQSLVNFDGQEQGLLGMAFHPNYSTNRKFYVNYTRDSATRADRHCRVPDLRLGSQPGRSLHSRADSAGDKPAIRQP